MKRAARRHGVHSRIDVLETCVDGATDMSLPLSALGTVVVAEQVWRAHSDVVVHVLTLSLLHVAHALAR